MHVLVTGAAGFIGSHVCEQLISSGHEVSGLDSFVPYYPRAMKERNLSQLMREPRFRFVERDLRTEPLADCLAGVEAVVHEAAMPGLVRSWDDFDLYMTCNISAVKRLLDACLAASVRRFVHVSTSSVYGANAVGDESQPTAPVSPYGVTKLAAEHLVLAYVKEFSFPATILRYFSVYGPRQRPDMAYHIFIKAMMEERPIMLYGDGRQSRSNTYVSDCVRGTLQALESARVGGIYNIGGGSVIELREAVDVIAEVLGVQPKIIFEQRRRGDQLHTSADVTRARNDFGYQPVVVPAEGLRAQVEWQRRQLIAED
jgi:nucleoside-diphosphate-sugar epimerase